MLAHAWQYFGPIFAVVVGWVLHELSDTIRARREDRRAAGRTLAELLDLRHLIRARVLLIKEIRSRTIVPPEAEPIIGNFISSLVGQVTQGMSDRYNKAVDSISGRDPLLAFELRSKDQLDPLMNTLRPLVGSDPAAGSKLSALENNLREELLPRLDALVYKLAWSHDWKTWVRVRWRSKNLHEASAELRSSLDSILKNVVPAPPQVEKPGS